MSAALHGTPAQIRQATWATRSLFAALGVVAGAWGVHIPSVKEVYDLTEGSLSLVLVAAALGTVSMLFFAGRVIGRLGPRNAVALAGVFMGLMLALVLHWPGYVPLLLATVLFGATMSIYDVGINTEGSALEAAGGRPIMGGLHGMFSVGAMSGAALAALLLRLEVPAVWQLGGTGLVASVWMVLASRWMLPTAPASQESADTPQFTWPRGALLIMGLLIFAGASAEGVMQDWSVLYLKQEVHMPQDRAAMGYAAFAGAMAVMRFLADILRTRFSERLLLRTTRKLSVTDFGLARLHEGADAVAAEHPHAGVAGAILGTRLLIFGGGASQSSASVQSLGLNSHQGSVAGRLPRAISDLAAALTESMVESGGQPCARNDVVANDGILGVALAALGPRQGRELAALPRRWRPKCYSRWLTLR